MIVEIKRTRLTDATSQRALMQLTTHMRVTGANPAGHTNQRNRLSGKTVITDDDPVDIEVPRHRDGQPWTFLMANGAA